jgi:hypothetical protein
MKRLRNRQLTIQRVVLVAVGIVVLGIAIVGFLLSFNIVKVSAMLDPDTTIINAASDRFIADHTMLLRVLAMAGGVVGVAVSFYWLRLQLPPARLQDDVTFKTIATTELGTSVVKGTALAHAFENDLLRGPEILQARAEMRLAENTIRLRLEVDQAASLEALINGPVQTALNRLSRVGEFPMPSLQTDVKLVDQERVRAT